MELKIRNEVNKYNIPVLTNIIMEYLNYSEGRFNCTVDIEYRYNPARNHNQRYNSDTFQEEYHNYLTDGLEHRINLKRKRDIMHKRGFRLVGQASGGQEKAYQRYLCYLEDMSYDEMYDLKNRKSFLKEYRELEYKLDISVRRIKADVGVK